MKDLRVELKLKNNLLYLAITSQYRNVARFCIECGLSPTCVGEYINLKKSPLTKRKTSARFTTDLYFSQVVIKIAEALQVSILDIFPPVTYEVRQSKFVAEMDSQEFLPYDDTVLLPLLNDSVELDYTDLHRVVGALDSMESTVLTHRFGLHGEPEKTLATCGDLLGVTRERVRQIEADALRKLRHPSRRKLFKDVRTVS